MYRDGALTIPEELLLLRVAGIASPIRPKREFSAFENKPLAAGQLIELVLARRVTVEDRRRHLLHYQDVVVLDPARTGDELLDGVLAQLDGAETKSCSHWIKRIAKGSEISYWDRLERRSLLRADPLRDAKNRPTADVQTVTAVRDRMRAALAQPEASTLRDVALVTLLARAHGLFGKLENVRLTPRAIGRAYFDSEHDDRAGRRAMDAYKRGAESSPDLSDDDRRWATTAADAIDWLARELEQSDA
jgi:hypothetical protein